MKTSLILSDHIFKKAKKKAEATGRTISDVIDEWSALGSQVDETKLAKKNDYKSFVAYSAGKVLIDIDSRKDWLDLAYEESDKRIK